MAKISFHHSSIGNFDLRPFYFLRNIFKNFLFARGEKKNDGMGGAIRHATPIVWASLVKMCLIWFISFMIQFNTILVKYCRTFLKLNHYSTFKNKPNLWMDRAFKWKLKHRFYWTLQRLYRLTIILQPFIYDLFQFHDQMANSSIKQKCCDPRALATLSPRHFHSAKTTKMLWGSFQGYSFNLLIDQREFIEESTGIL